MTEASATPPALSRFHVLDLTRVRAGPTAVRQLADFGADVLKIEAPARPGDAALGGPRDGPDFQNLHRNKRAMTLDLKQPDGHAIFLRLVEDADVVVENYRPDVKHRLKIDYESLRTVNPRLVYGSISGFGQDGPYGARPGFDQIAQGMGGLMSVTGLAGQGPVRAGIPVADLAAGLYCALAILVALLEREVSGEGQWVQSSLLGAQVQMLDFQAARWLIGRDVPTQAGNNHPTSIPTGVFPTRDGHINIAASGDEIFRRLCRSLDAGQLLDDAAYATDADRSRNRDPLNAALAEITATYTSAELVETLNQAGVPSGPIYAIDQVFADPQVRHLGMAQAIDHPRLGRIEVVGQAATLSRTPSRIRRPTPDQGEHTDAVLGALGLDGAAIADLRRRGVV